ncbi:exosortase family protein XrtG [Weissella coleopterorum]|uniref:Exosortase family protein XrtG n=1 Tax=Weissella coleopterorum TaxID=2714949 RepID=A0A6G8AZF1_9LACO|nr:exosortase family protein XrtG [Weissella coleopterorum]QIL50360.1 exosortase family protein XrtG [Weissella coleopterorum]
MYWLIVLAMFLWVYLLSIMQKAKWMAMYSVIGVVGLFFIIIYFSNYSMTSFLMKSAAFGAGVFGSLTGFYHISLEYSMIQIHSGFNTINLFITYECSAVIELGAFIALTSFYPFFQDTKERIHWIAIGLPYIYISNVLRLIITATIVHYFGINSLVWAHVIIGRIIFYVLTIILYYIVFTRVQILNVRVGKFKFNSGES